MPEYVNNEDLIKAIEEYQEEYSKRKSKNDGYPKMSEELGGYILLIASNLAKRPNFSGYTYKDEMISDGIENVIKYIHNFNKEKGNAFAYVTQILYYAFLRRIHSEKKQQYVKLVAFEQAGVYGLLQDLDREMFENKYPDNPDPYQESNTLDLNDISGIKKDVSSKMGLSDNDITEFGKKRKI